MSEGENCRRYGAGSNSRISAPECTPNFEVSKLETALMPEQPAMRRSQNSSLPVPIELTIPRPVTTTRCSSAFFAIELISSESSIIARVLSSRGRGQIRKSGGLSCPLAYEEAPDRGLTWRGKCCYVGTRELLSGGSAYQNTRENSHILHRKSDFLEKF